MESRGNNCSAHGNDKGKTNTLLEAFVELETTLQTQAVGARWSNQGSTSLKERSETSTLYGAYSMLQA
jgi:hypothetical protein